MNGEDSDDYMSGSDDQDIKKKGTKKEEEFYTEGSDDLKNARLAIAKYSIPKAQARLNESKSRRERSIKDP